MSGRAAPTLVFEFEPAPRAIPKAAQRVRDQLRPQFIEDLMAAHYPDDIAETIRERVRQKQQGSRGQNIGTDLTDGGTMLDAMKGLKLAGEPAVKFFGLHPGNRPGSPTRLTNELLAWFHEGGTRPPRRHGTGFKSPRVRTGSRRKGQKGGMKPKPFFGLTKGETAFATGTAAVLFQVHTLPKLIAEWERDQGL